MNRVRPLVTRALLTLATWLLLAGGPASAQEPRPGPDVSTDPADKAACKSQLNRITGAIREYRKEHGNQLPERLSDLAPGYIADRDVLVCPYVRKRGGLQVWGKRLIQLVSDPHTSYSYEFPPVPVSHYYWRGLPKKTWQDFKERQQELLGDGTPIVRCHDHFPELNLAAGGQIYESGRNWEENFGAHSDLRLDLEKMFPSPPASRLLKPEDFPPREPRAPLRLLDLTAWYNATLTNSWQGFGGNDLASLPTGIQKFGGVQFDVRGVIQLRGQQIPAMFPWRVDGIQVGQKCKRIHFLHGLSCTRTGSQAIYSMHYADGQVVEFHVMYEQHIADWWHKSTRPAKLGGAKVAWSGQNEASKAFGMSISLYDAVWDNPRQDTEIKSISLDAKFEPWPAGPFVVAITLE